MSKIKKDLRGLLSAQQLLFDDQIVEGYLDLSMPFRESLSQALRKHSSSSNDSRYAVAAKVSELVGRNISKDMLDKYTSNNPEYGIRAEDLPAFCAAVRSVTPFRVLLNPLGHEVIGPDEAEDVRLARIERQIRELQAEATRIKSRPGNK